MALIALVATAYDKEGDKFDYVRYLKAHINFVSAQDQLKEWIKNKIDASIAEVKIGLRAEIEVLAYLGNYISHSHRIISPAGIIMYIVLDEKYVNELHGQISNAIDCEEKKHVIKKEENVTYIDFKK
ncbi:hypothetical protein ETTORE_0395 [Pseudomonas phage Ettore]|nr:hypothetical protein ETTORE_0395 [Pseudomonas phage Ettore]BDR25949.1 hypothetical protein RVBP16_3890 [Pseudomonas phage sp. 30-2]